MEDWRVLAFFGALYLGVGLFTPDNRQTSMVYPPNKGLIKVIVNTDDENKHIISGTIIHEEPVVEERHFLGNPTYKGYCLGLLYEKKLFVCCNFDPSSFYRLSAGFKKGTFVNVECPPYWKEKPTKCKLPTKDRGELEHHTMYCQLTEFDEPYEPDKQ
jgi:hypothetical protein